MPLNENHSSIRKRMTMLNYLIFAFIGLLVIAYSYQFISIEKNLLVMEDFHDLFDNVLEVRRYEKNYFLGVGTENIQTILEFLARISDDTDRLGSNISSVSGKENAQAFSQTLSSYRNFFINLAVPNSSYGVNQNDIRQKGKALVNFSEQLLDGKQQRLRNSFKITIFSFIFITGLFFVFVIIALHQQAKSVLDRIAFIQQATKNISRGSFQPIEYDHVHQDEITDLIEAFNTMASELEMKQEQLIQSRKLASIGTFSSGIAHELNNPLNNISLSADTLLEDFTDELPDEAMEIIEDIISQTDRATEVVKNLLDFSRDKVPSTQPLLIKNILTATRKLIANELRLNAIWFEEYLPDNLPPIMGDMQKLQQVFLNLFVNSMHVMPEGGLIYIDAEEQENGFVKINVSDTGAGISPDHIEHIFDPFFTTKQVGKGTGLGLSIVYGIIKKHNGSIGVKSKLNAGTTFSIFLPIASVHASPSGEQA